MDEDWFAEPFNPTTAAEFALARRPDRTYISRSWPLSYPVTSQDFGQPGRYIRKVFDDPEPMGEPGQATDSFQSAERFIVTTTPKGRNQVELQVVREPGNVRKLRIQRIQNVATSSPRLQTLLQLDRQGSARLIALIKALKHIPVTGDNTVRIDDDLLSEVLADPEALRSLYLSDPDAIRRQIQEDASATDIVALAHRRDVVERFRRMLNDDDFFNGEQAAAGIGPERVWQNLLEANPWILGIGLAGQLLTSWSDERLEQTVAGYSIAGSGKRTDALMRTSGRIRSMVFAEIKHHRTELLQLVKRPYREDCWAPSEELAGGIIQVQQTVYRATAEIGERLADRSADGYETGEFTYLIRPRMFLIAGKLTEFTDGAGNIHRAKHRSFELFRRNLWEPDVITFDELLARAEWHVATAERQSES